MKNWLIRESTLENKLPELNVSLSHDSFGKFKKKLSNPERVTMQDRDGVLGTGERRDRRGGVSPIRRVGGGCLGRRTTTASCS